MPSTDSERSRHAQLAALARSARAPSGTAMTETARRTFQESFDTGHKCSLCPETVIDPGLPPADRRRMAEAARKAHYTRISLQRDVIRRRAVEAVEAAIDTAAAAVAELQRLDDAV